MINWRKRERDRIPIGTETPKVEIVFKMVLSTDISSPAPGKSVSCQISKNGSAFQVPESRVREIGNGWYKILIAIDDLINSVLILKFTASGCAQNDYVFIDAQLRAP